MNTIAIYHVFFSSRNVPVSIPSSILAWNSTPGIDLSGSIGERNASWINVPYSQTSTIFPLNAPSGMLPSSTSIREYDGYPSGL